MSNTEALNVALALQQLVRGVNSLLDNDKIMGEEISKLKARMDAQDRDARLWEEDRKKFLEMANEKMERTRAANPVEDKEKLRVLTANKVGQAAKLAAANQAMVAEKIKNEPKVTLMWPGKSEQVRGQGGTTQFVQRPIVVRIGNLEYGGRFRPGEMVSVPQSIATRIEQHLRNEAEQAERNALMDASPGKAKEDTIIAAKWHEINSRYGSNSQEVFPIASR